MADNLAFACQHCNRHKGTDLGSLDPESRTLTPLFNPRTQVWHEHFALDGARIVARTSTGRVTIAILQLNHPRRVLEREGLIRLGRYP